MIFHLNIKRGWTIPFNGVNWNYEIMSAQLYSYWRSGTPERLLWTDWMLFVLSSLSYCSFSLLHCLSCLSFHLCLTIEGPVLHTLLFFYLIASHWLTFHPQSLRRPSCCLTGRAMGRSATASVGTSCGPWDKTLSTQKSSRSWAIPRQRVRPYKHTDMTVSIWIPDGFLFDASKSTKKKKLYIPTHTVFVLYLGTRLGWILFS